MNSDNKEGAAFVTRMRERLRKSTGASLRGRHRAAFIAVRPLVEAALLAGYTMKATWQALREEGKVSMTYETFRTHCRRLRRSTQVSQGPDPVVGSGARTLARNETHGVPARQGATTGPTASPSNQPRTFRHNRIPRKDEIYG